MSAQTDPAPVQDSTREAHDPGVVHEVDGIKEYDNNLPNWWLTTFYGAIVFSMAYFFYYHVLDGDTLSRTYRKEMAVRMAAQGEAEPVTAAMLEDLSKDGAQMGQAAQLFSSTCASCHGAGGIGLVGPNLTDDFWMHGGSNEQIYASIHDGYPAKGMPAWAGSLGEAKIPMLAAYVIGLRGTNAAGGKPPQGDKYTP